MGVDDGSGAPGRRADDGMTVIKTRWPPSLSIVVMLLQEADKTREISGSLEKIRGSGSTLTHVELNAGQLKGEAGNH